MDRGRDSHGQMCTHGLSGFGIKGAEKVQWTERECNVMLSPEEIAPLELYILIYCLLSNNEEILALSVQSFGVNLKLECSGIKVFSL